MKLTDVRKAISSECELCGDKFTSGKKGEVYLSVGERQHFYTKSISDVSRFVKGHGETMHLCDDCFTERLTPNGEPKKWKQWGLSFKNARK